MRFQTGLIVVFGGVYAAVLASSCKGASSGTASEAGVEDGSGDDASEPAICMQFSAVGDPCPTASPVRCFPECDSGGCFCKSTGTGGPPRWACTVDLSCVPDCAPLDDGCSPATTGDDGPDKALDDGPADAPGDGPPDAASDALDSAGDGAADGGASD